MKNRMGNMDIPFSEVYNEEDDVYYVTFNTSEPSYCQEIDDILIMELGLFTHLPTGFRILNFSKNRVKIVKFSVLLKKIKEALQDVDLPRLKDRETQVKEALEEVFA
ncbi:MAG: hypothetical protein Q8O01_01195 [Candidatus Omnitrophota bacterium]|nr:hypothetical protein [Candidatus Omnitrophota bacterium]